MREEKISSEQIEQNRKDRAALYTGRFACDARALLGHIPLTEFLFDKELTDTERIVGQTIVYRTFAGTYSSLLNVDTISDLLGHSENTVVKALRGLQSKNRIRILPRWNKKKKKYNRNKNEYYFVFGPWCDDLGLSIADIRKYLYQMPDGVNPPEDKRIYGKKDNVIPLGQAKVDRAEKERLSADEAAKKAEEDKWSDDELLAELDTL